MEVNIEMAEREVQKQQKGNDESPFAGLEKAYDWASKNDWENVIRHFEGNRHQLLTALTLHKHTVFHIAASSIRRGKDVQERLLDLLPTVEDKCDALMSYNCRGNNVLHEVAKSGNVAAARLLLDMPECGRRLLEKRNNLGETPVYRAAAFGSTNLLIFFDDRVDFQNHFHRDRDNMSILHIAVVSQHFGTALWLNTKFEHLGEKREDKGLTSLQLLAQMPLAFKPKFIHNNSWIKMLIYHCKTCSKREFIKRLFK